MRLRPGRACPGLHAKEDWRGSVGPLVLAKVPMVLSDNHGWSRLEPIPCSGPQEDLLIVARSACSSDRH